MKNLGGFEVKETPNHKYIVTMVVGSMLLLFVGGLIKIGLGV